MAEKFTSITGSFGSKEAFSKGKKKTSPAATALVVVLILLSLGAFLWFANKGGTQEQQEEVEEHVPEEADQEVLGETEEELEEEPAMIEEEEEPVSFDDSDFSQDNQQVGEEGVTDIKISKINKSGNNNYYSLEFVLEGSDKIPYTTASIKANSNLITFKISGVTEDKSGIKPGDGIDIENSVVSKVFHEVSSEGNIAHYSVGIRSLTSFYLHTLSGPTRIVLDVLEQEVEGGDGQEFQFSTGAQNIEGNASGNVILVNGLNYSDQGSAFRIIWKLGTIGTGTIPNVTGEIVDFEGGKAIRLVVNNVYSDFPAENNYDQNYTHSIVKGVKGSFASHTSTYYIRLASVREYKLYFMSAPAQLIVDVKR